MLMSPETILPWRPILIYFLVSLMKKWELEECDLPPPHFRFTCKLNTYFKKFVGMQFLGLHTFSNIHIIRNFETQEKMRWISVSNFPLNLEKLLQEMCV